MNIDIDKVYTGCDVNRSEDSKIAIVANPKGLSHSTSEVLRQERASISSWPRFGDTIYIYIYKKSKKWFKSSEIER